MHDELIEVGARHDKCFFWPLASEVRCFVSHSCTDDDTWLCFSPRDGGLFFITEAFCRGLKSKIIGAPDMGLLPEERAALVWHVQRHFIQWLDSSLKHRRWPAPDSCIFAVLRNPNRFKNEFPLVNVDWIERHRLILPAAKERLDSFMGEIIRQADWPMNDPEGRMAPIHNSFLKAAACAWEGRQGDVQRLFAYCQQEGWLSEESGAGLKFAGRVDFEKRQEEEKRSQQGFVAMWFPNEESGKARLGSLYDGGISPAVSAAGYSPYLANNVPGELGKIDDLIMKEIQRSRFLIADLTGTRPNVLYEAGYAKGLGIPVIFTAEKCMLEEKRLPFDVQQYRTIGWESDKLRDFQEQLAAHISVALGPGPNTLESNLV